MNGRDLDRMNSVDDMIESPEQHSVRKLVQALPEESLSLAWRSSLNEKLLETAAAKKRRNRLNWILRPALGLGLASVLAVIVLFHPSQAPKSSTPDRGIESAIVSDHRASVLLGEVSSAGLNVNEVASEANPQEPDDGLWTDSDVQGL
ncbi:MAG: hypothetical protein P4L46_07170 [Fimbriimonas sp.]|nr:hypothetical protein [Fimbriimonas sp.]